MAEDNQSDEGATAGATNPASTAAPAAATPPATAAPRNLNPQKFIGDLGAAGSAIDQLKVLADRIESRAISTINWYLKKKTSPQRWSQWARGFAILLATLGGMAPLISGAMPLDSNINALSLDRFGYLFIAAAAAILMTDRYFGFSSSWMRYMTAQMALQRALEKFQLSWGVWQIQVANRNSPGVAAATLPAELANSAVTLLLNFQAEIGELVDQEFQLWIAEFKEQLANLQSAVSKDKEDQRPGNVVVNIAASGSLAGPSGIYLDHRLIESTSSSAALLNGVSPGSHLLTVKAKSADGTPLESSQHVTVAAGLTVKADLTLAPSVVGLIHAA